MAKNCICTNPKKEKNKPEFTSLLIVDVKLIALSLSLDFNCAARNLRFTTFVSVHSICLLAPRPPWDADTTAEQLELLERESFLAWRRSLVQLQEDERLTLTPFERNLEFWRQLWRVVEKR